MRHPLQKYQVESVGGVFIASTLITDFITQFTLSVVGVNEREAIVELKHQYWLFNKYHAEKI